MGRFLSTSFSNIFSFHFEVTHLQPQDYLMLMKQMMLIMFPACSSTSMFLHVPACSSMFFHVLPLHVVAVRARLRFLLDEVYDCVDFCWIANSHSPNRN